MTPEQLKECRKEFEKFIARKWGNTHLDEILSGDFIYHDSEINSQWIGFQGCWEMLKCNSSSSEA